MGGCLRKRLLSRQQEQDSTATNGGHNLSQTKAPTETAEERPPTPPFPDPRAKVVVALYNYDARADDDLSFRKGDHLEIRDDSGEWWLARDRIKGKRGFIPCNYVAQIDTLEAEPWFFGDVKRPEAERLLMQSTNGSGSFLIRRSENKASQHYEWYAASLRDADAVRHYRIKRTDSGNFFISRKHEFQSLQQLVSHYSTDADGLIVALKEPCQKEKATVWDLSHKTADQWEISRSSLVIGQKLGAGQFGEVCEGLWNNTTAVAIKSLKPGTMKREAFLDEARTMKRLRHPKLIQLYAVVTVGEPLLIVTELMCKGSLLDYLRGDGSKLPIVKLIDIDAQVAQGMAFLESKNFIHRDLAARNVLVEENDQVKIADFGLSRCVDDDLYVAHEGSKFPIKWTAPEACNFNKFSTKSDVWSFGVLMYEVVTSGRMPYAGMANAEALQAVDRGYRMPCPPNCPKEYYEVMSQCWKREADERPTFETLQWMLEEFFQDRKTYFDSENP